MKNIIGKSAYSDSLSFELSKLFIFTRFTIIFSSFEFYLLLVKLRRLRTLLSLLLWLLGLEVSIVNIISPNFLIVRFFLIVMIILFTRTRIIKISLQSRILTERYSFKLFIRKEEEYSTRYVKYKTDDIDNESEHFDIAVFVQIIFILNGGQKLYQKDYCKVQTEEDENHNHLMTHLPRCQKQNQQQHYAEYSGQNGFCYNIQNSDDEKHGHEEIYRFLIVSSFFGCGDRSRTQTSQTHLNCLVYIIMYQNTILCIELTSKSFLILQFNNTITTITFIICYPQKITFNINRIELIKMGCGAVEANAAQKPSSKISPKELRQSINSNRKGNPNIIPSFKKFQNLPQQKDIINKSYAIKQMIGKGSYGQVYRCVQESSGEQFALKVVKLNSKTKEQAIKQIKSLKSEISVLRKLNHPNIINPDNDSVQIVFELVKEGSLKDYLNNFGPLREQEASLICKQILQGLKYLHSQSVIHRDLKCANILITENGVPKITDFGTAKEVKVNTNQDIAKLCASLKGTPYYMAPQILKRSGHFKSADIWSFGCTLIQMLSGKAPWTTLTNSFEQIISYIISGIHPPLPPNISKQCQFFLQSCFDPVPSQRLSAEELLNHRFIKNQKRGQGSIVYETIDSAEQNGKMNKKRPNQKTLKKQVQIIDMNSIQITRRKKSQVGQNIQTSQHHRNGNANDNKNIQKKLFIDDDSSMIGSKRYKGQKSKSKKDEYHAIKKNAKTAGYVKMTQQNLSEWKQIQAQMIDGTNFKHSRPKPYSEFVNKEPKVNSKNKIIRSNTEMSDRQEVINTSLAQEQREKYENMKMQRKKKKQEQAKKWEQQLKRQRQILRKQKSNGAFND